MNWLLVGAFNFNLVGAILMLTASVRMRGELGVLGRQLIADNPKLKSACPMTNPALPNGVDRRSPFWLLAPRQGSRKLSAENPAQPIDKFRF
jgi:hypothetical protein